MKIKKLISLGCLILLVLVSIHVFIHGAGQGDSSVGLLVSAVIIIFPILIPLLISIFKRGLFHPLYWTFTILIIALVFYLKSLSAYTSPVFEDTNLTTRYFENKAGFFTTYSPIVIFNQDIDSASHNDDHIMKCIYRLGKSKFENYYMGKIKINNHRVVKEYYNQRVKDDITFFKTEFGKRVESFKELEPVFKLIKLQ